jgi:hypothetical protein
MTLLSYQKVYYDDFMFSLFAIFTQLHLYINIHTSMSLSVLITQNFIFGPNWPYQVCKIFQ